MRIRLSFLTTQKACFQDVAPDAAGAVGAGARHKARPFRRLDRLAFPRTRAEATFQPGAEARPRYAQRFAELRRRPDGTVLHNEAELDVDPLAK